MIAKHYGRSISLDTLREQTQIAKEGVNLIGIGEAAEFFGFRTHSVKLTFNTLITDANLPAILHWN
jgi:ATP-binding cassette, subfamily B, bacterial